MKLLNAGLFRSRPDRGVFMVLLMCLVGCRANVPAAALQFVVTLSPTLTNAPVDGRLFVIITDSAQPEPRLRLGRTASEAPLLALARDVSSFAPGQTSI